MSTLRPILSLLTGFFFLIIGHGLQMTLLPLRAHLEGWTPVEIGVLGSAYYVGFVGGCFGAPYLIRHAGHIRAFTALVALISATMVSLPLAVAFWPWIVLRALIGFGLAGLYMIIESWLNDRAENTNRGLIMSIYIMVNYAALAIGQATIVLASPATFTLFAFATITMSIAAIPLALTRQAQPQPVSTIRFRPLELYRASPVGFVGVCAVGIANGAFWALGTVAAVGAGLSVRDAALFMGLVTACGALAQWPVGRLSDRVDRRLVLIGVLIAAAVFGALFAFLPVSGPLWFVIAAFFGMSIAPGYSIAAAHTYDHAPPGAFVETAAGLFLSSAAGSIVGPLLASQVMEAFGPSKLFLFTAVVQLALAAFALSRLGRRAAPTPEEKTDFNLAVSVPVGGALPIDPDAITEQPAERPPDAAP